MIPGALLTHLLKAAVQIADLDIAVEYFFPVKGEVEFDCAVGCRMGRTHLQFHDFRGGVVFGNLTPLCPPR